MLPPRSDLPAIPYLSEAIAIRVAGGHDHVDPALHMSPSLAIDSFEIDRHHVAVAALAELIRIGRLPLEKLQSALTRYQLDVDKLAPWTL